MTTVSSYTSSATYLANGGYFLQSIQSTGNWMLDAVSNDSSNWMDPSSSGPDFVDMAANAFALAQTATTTTLGNMAINQGIQSAQSQLNDLLGVGQLVNVFA